MRKNARLIYIDTNKSKIKQFNISFPKIFLGIVLFIFLIGIALKISSDLMIRLNHNSKIARLRKENLILQKQIEMQAEKIAFLREQIDQIEKLDDEIRMHLDMPPIPEDVREVGIGGSDISQFSSLDLDNPGVQAAITNNNIILDRLEREIKLESESFKKLLTTVERKKDSLRFLPALKPVPGGRETDGFRKRRHPILGRIMMHWGQDFAANRGTPVIAPADGYVTFAGRNGAYGLFISIDHKYGYETRYGHLQKIYVRKGQFVKRGDKIGEVGNTGRSTAPHLHYEVRYKGKPVDPREYYFPDIEFSWNN